MPQIQCPVCKKPISYSKRNTAKEAIEIHKKSCVGKPKTEETETKIDLPDLTGTKVAIESNNIYGDKSVITKGRGKQSKFNRSS